MEQLGAVKIFGILIYSIYYLTAHIRRPIKKEGLDDHSATCWSKIEEI
jgi:hypothetical protein